MSRLLLATALGVEAVPVRRAVRRRVPSAARVVVAGAGRRARAVPAAPGEVVAVLGVCGALSPQLQPGDVVVASEVRGPVGTRTCPSAPLVAALLRDAGLPVHVGPLLTAERVVTSRTERARHAATGALAADTETATLLADLPADVPVVAVRVVVDTADAPLVAPGMLIRGMRALARLAPVTRALLDWAELCGPRNALLAEPRSFCAGVERAIGTVEAVLDRVRTTANGNGHANGHSNGNSNGHSNGGPGNGRRTPVYVRRHIVHNSHVVADLERRGAVFVRELDEVPDGATVVLAAHGVAPSVRSEASQRGLQVIDATCPLVAKVHAEVRHADARGDSIVLIGHGDHEEVEGTLGEAPGRVAVVESVDDVAALDVPDPSRVTWVTQTTLAVDETQRVVDALLARFPGARGPASEDICYATSNRQAAVRAMSDEADLVLVLGSPTSSNSLRLVEVAERAGVEAHLVDDAGQVRPQWLRGRRRIGLTAGASAPPRLVEEVVELLRGLGPVTVSSRGIGVEDVTFELPKEVRR